MRIGSTQARLHTARPGGAFPEHWLEPPSSDPKLTFLRLCRCGDAKMADDIGRHPPMWRAVALASVAAAGQSYAVGAASARARNQLGGARRRLARLQLAPVGQVQHAALRRGSNCR